MTKIAAEGLPLTTALEGLVANDASDLAALVCRMHHDKNVNAFASAAGLEMIWRSFSMTRVMEDLEKAIG
jgi:hypothetical protein